jgi:carboxyl-terminal processing protease
MGKNNLKTITFFLLLQTILTAAAFAAGFLSRDHLANQSNIFPILTQAYNILKNHGLKELPAFSSLQYGMVRGMLQAYDEPHTTFVEPPQHELQTNQLEGKFGGIGSRLERDPDGYIFLFPFADSPAVLSGVQEGDRLLAVGNLQIDADTNMDDILAAIRGPVGDKVILIIGHAPEYLPLAVTIKRDEVSLPSVTWNIAQGDPRIGLIQINTIAATTPKETQRAIDDLMERDASYFILDLRHNFGGLVDAGVDTAQLFLEKGDAIISEQYRGQDEETFVAKQDGPFKEIPLVVLVSNQTASAAEIIAGALQGQGRAQLIGVPTYGKDSIQLIFDLDDGSSIHVTSARWWIAGYGSITGTGLQPDIILAEENMQDQQPVQAAIKHLLDE